MRLVLADLILALHVLIVVFNVVFPIAVLVGARRGMAWVHRPSWRLGHLGLIAYVVVNTWAGELCPLTVWEHALRDAAPDGAQSLIARWSHAVLYIEAPLWMFAVAYSAFALFVLLTFVWVPVHWSDRRADPGRGGR